MTDLKNPQRDDGKLNEKLNDALLYSVGGKHADHISEETDQLLDDYGDIQVPESLDEWFSRLEKQNEKKDRARKGMSKAGKMAAVIIAALSLCTAISAFSVDAVRVKLIDIFTEVRDSFGSVDFGGEKLVDFDSSELPPDWCGYYPTKLPRGYVLTDTQYSERGSYLAFEDGGAATLIFAEDPLNSDVLIDSQDAVVTQTDINGMEGVISDKGDSCIIVWHNDEFIFTLIGQISKTTLIEIAESVTK